MNIQYNYIPFKGFSQAVNYGEDEFGTQIYSCEDGDTACVIAAESGSGTVAPNTGFLGMSQDAAFTAIAGGVLLLVALVAGVGFMIAKSRKRKNTQE